MERAVVIAAAILVLAIVGSIGAGVGFVFLMGDPAFLVQRQCASGQMGPPGGCKNLVITARTRDRVDYSYELADGTHCQGFQQVDKRGFLGLAMGGEGGTTCTPSPVTVGPSASPLFPDGNPGCTSLSLAGPTATASGFQLVATNAGPVTCDIGGLAKLEFLDADGKPLNIDMQFSSSALPVALQPGASAIYDFQTGQGRCPTPATMLVVNEAGSQQLGAPASVCPPIFENPAKPAA
jgi:Protein of unknown function (DUF4232)